MTSNILSPNASGVNTQPDENTSILDHALAYAALGWPVFPCHTPLESPGWNCTCEQWRRKKVSADFDCQHAGKHPRTKNGLDDATTDAAQIRDWWRKWPTANIGINCGKAGLLIVDLDTYRDTYQGDDLELDEETVTALSGGGGAHLFYRLDAGDQFGNSNKNLPNGIDIRGYGGYVIVAPSLHKSGQLYQWENDYAPWDKPIAPIPPKLRELLTKKTQKPQSNAAVGTSRKFEENATRYGAKAIENQCALVAASANGRRNTTLNTAAFSLGRLVAGGEIDPDYAHAELLSAARVVGLTDAEAERTIQSGFSAGKMDPKMATRTAGQSERPQASVEAITRAIAEIAGDESLSPAERKRRIVKELAFDIGTLQRSDHALIIEALEEADAGFSKTDAKSFVGGCVADAKQRNKEAQRQRAEEARQNLLAVRAEKGKRSIDVGNRQLSDIIADAMQAIKEDNADQPKTFIRSGALVRIAQDERDHTSIQEFSTGALLAKLADVADWETVTIDAEGNPKTQAVFPPRDAIAAILGAGEWPGIPPLGGVVNAPIFSRDGKLHDQPGYDKDTKFYYTGGVEVGDTTPTEANIDAAKDLIIDNLLVDFPFKDDASRAHAVAYLLLPFVRDRISGPTPVHIVDAPSAGTGKGLLLNACAYAALGHDVPTMPAAKDDDEWRKRISSSLMSGNSHVVIDNVNHEMDSGSLASAFTQPVWQDRVLGSNREIKIPVRTIWGITANNIKLSQELARRCIWIRLDANAEQPWIRDGFKHKRLISWASEHRDELATAAITLIRAWITKGQPLYTKRTKGSYEEWAGVMGGILEVVGIPGFLDNEAALYDRVVSKSNLLIDFVKAWWEKQRARTEAYHAEVATKGESKIERDLSSNDLFKLASYSEDDDPFDEWHNLLGEMLGDGKPRSRQTKLGGILSEHQDKVVGGYKILLAKTAKGMKYWRLESTKPAIVSQEVEANDFVINFG